MSARAYDIADIFEAQRSKTPDIGRFRAFESTRDIADNCDNADICRRLTKTPLG